MRKYIVLFCALVYIGLSIINCNMHMRLKLVRLEMVPMKK
jgi:hypothetical protein